MVEALKADDAGQPPTRTVSLQANAETAPANTTGVRPTSSKLVRSVSSHQANLAKPDGYHGGPAPKIDPLSRHILKRTNTENMIPQSLRAGGPPDEDSPAAEEAARPSTNLQSAPNAPPVQRVESGISNKLSKDRDKKKGVSFLSRFIGTKKRDSTLDVFDNASEPADNRTTGMDAELFSQPIGFIPRFPPPPRYIKVRAQNRKEKDFDRVFLAQLLQGSESKRKRSTDDTDAVAATADTASGSNKSVWAMKFSKDGQYLAAAGQDKIVRVWQVMSHTEDRQAFETEEDGKNGKASGTRLNAPVFKKRLVREYDGHTSSVLDLSWSKNNFLLSSSMDKTVRLWHVSRQECLCAFKHSDFVTSIQFHPRDDRFFLAGSLDSKLRLWSIPDKSVAFWAQVPDMVTAVAFTPDGKHSIAGCLNGLCLFYETEGLKINAQIHVRSARGRNAKGSKITGIDAITLPRESPTGETKLLITSNDSRVRMYNFKDRQLEVKFRGNENSCSQIHATFSDDGKYVICGSEDRKVYIWPTGPVESDKDQDKRPVEIFEAHSAIVTTAVLAPTKTRQLLAHAGDPIYDICNPPPVTLLSRSESVISSKAPTESAQSMKDGQVPPTPRTTASRKAEEKPSYLARSAHTGGNIIVTADFTGTIKVFRQDCAYQKRRQDSWDSGSVFSKKILGRSGSVMTRTSVGSSRRQTSLSKNGNGHGPNDRILSWRNSVAAPSHNSQDTLRSIHSDQARTRSISPKKSISQLSQQATARHSTPLIAASVNSPSASTNSPPPSLHKSSGDSAFASSTSAHTPPESAQDHANAGQDDVLRLRGDHSYRYWNRDVLSSMANRKPRSPGKLSTDDVDPLSRKGSVVSKLSSEDDSKSGSRFEDADDAPLQCNKCGAREFRASKTKRGRTQALLCMKCGKEA